MKECEDIEPMENNGCGKLPELEMCRPPYIYVGDLEELIKQTPNDTDLGKLIRERYGNN